MRRRRDMSVTDKIFSAMFRNSLEVLAIVQELAAMAGFACLNRLCEEDPAIVNRYCAIAEAALRALNRLQRKQKNLPRAFFDLVCL